MRLSFISFIQSHFKRWRGCFQLLSLPHQGNVLKIDLRRLPLDMTAVLQAGMLSGMPHRE
jgi:hypothetical protein